VVGEPDRIIRAEDRAEYRLALALRYGRDVVPGDLQDVEREQDDGRLVQTHRVGVVDVHAALQLGEARAVTVERHDLAVDDEVAGRGARQRVHHLRVLARHHQPVPRHQADGGVAREGEASLAVELAFEDPLRVGEPAIGQRRQHGRHPLGLGAPDGEPHGAGTQCVEGVAALPGRCHGRSP